jgi:hypothetical protein
MTDLTISKTILSQLGGGRFVAMTGAREFVGGEFTLRFKVPRKGYCLVTLTPADVYTVTFFKVVKGAVRTTKEVRDVYAEDLQNVFTEATGLYTHL